MKNILIPLVFLLTSKIALAESESYQCKFSGNTNWVTLRVDLTKKILVWGDDEMYDIKHNNKDYVTAYGRMGYTDHVGGAVMILDRKNMKLHLTEMALLVREEDQTQKYINSDYAVAECKAK